MATRPAPATRSCSERQCSAGSGATSGRSVTVTVNGRPLRARIVGRAVFPNFGQGSFTPTDLGKGAETTAACSSSRQAARSCRPVPRYNFVLIRFTPGPRRAADIAAFQRSMAAFCRRLGRPPVW